jgi:hypothetical protein
MVTKAKNVPFREKDGFLIFFHPDYNRRRRNLTGSVRGLFMGREVAGYTAGRELR